MGRRPKQGGQTDGSRGGASPRERILSAGERLFAEHGYAAVGVRAITAAAEVNLGALHYYFGSKESLIEAIFERRVRPIADERLRLLAQCREADGAPLLEQIIESFLRPGLTSGADTAEERLAYQKLRARFPAESEALANRILRNAFNESSSKYIDALVHALPKLSRAEVYWRFHFLLGVNLFTVTNGNRIRELSAGLCDPHDIEQALRHMIPFLAAGFRSPSVPEK